MPLQPPNLDDRDFYQLLDEAKRRIQQSCPEWTDLSPGDPGIVILELFAHLTEIMIYRLNRLPEKAYIEFLRLLGVRLQPPRAAATTLRFSLSRTQDHPVHIPRFTRVTVSRSPGGETPPVFLTAREAAIQPGESYVDLVAYHCEMVVGELAGRGTGLPGLSVNGRRPPIIAPTGDDLDLVVGVEVNPDEITERAPALRYDGKTFRIWRETENFTNLGPDRFVYIVDRMTGTITFAPAVSMKSADGKLEPYPEALAEVVPEGREIRLWYPYGGGSEGNMAANTLTVLKDPIPGVQVTNPIPATGGQAAESLENALLRGPQELHSLRRAVTAHDFELLALRSSGAVCRARAFSAAELWNYAAPGTVAVLLVPHIPEETRGEGPISAEMLREQEIEDVCLRIEEALNERRPLGTTCLVNWVRYKTVSVKAKVVVYEEEDPIGVKDRVIKRLNRTINPLPTGQDSPGWRFGRPLRASNVYDIVLAEPGVNYVDQVSLLVDEVPEENIVSLVEDKFQFSTWYAATRQKLFRTLNDGEGWEVLADFNSQEIELVSVHPETSGLLAVATCQAENPGSSYIYVSSNCGETWRMASQTAFEVRDMAWTVREGMQVLLLATDVGLYELVMQEDASPVQVLVDAEDQDQGFYTVLVTTDIQGTNYVAVAAQRQGGVYLSSQSGRGRTFVLTGLEGHDVRVLEVQKDGPRSFLWAGLAVPGNEEGEGCYRWELRGSEAPPEGWVQFQRNWSGGSCYSLAFRGMNVLAATHRAGVLWLDSSKSDAAWNKPELGCGLPIGDVERLFQRVAAVAVDPEGRLIMTGGPRGIYASTDNVQYQLRSSREFSEKVTLPGTWLFCSGEHDIEVVRENETD